MAMKKADHVNDAKHKESNNDAAPKRKGEGKDSGKE